jgi:hypothetical protein
MLQLHRPRYQGARQAPKISPVENAMTMARAEQPVAGEMIRFQWL